MNSTTPDIDLTVLRKQLAEKPGGILEMIAEKHGVPLRTVVDCLPEEMRTTVSGDRFQEVLADIASWGPVTVIVHTKDVILEFCGSFPEGSSAGGFYNLHGRTGIGGHLRPDRCRSIVFLRRPFMGKSTASIQFFNETGEAMFKVFLGRDEAGELRSEQLDRFEALERRGGTAPN